MFEMDAGRGPARRHGEAGVGGRRFGKAGTAGAVFHLCPRLSSWDVEKYGRPIEDSPPWAKGWGFNEVKI